MTISKSTTTQQFEGESQAVLYACVASFESSAKSFSIPAQLEMLRNYAHAKGLTITKEFVDVQTPNTEARPGFAAMVEFLRANTSVSHLLVESGDRLVRNFADCVYMDDLECAVHFVREGQVVPRFSESPEKLIHSIDWLITKNYIDELSKKVCKGMSENAEVGIWPPCASIGYKNVLLRSGQRGIRPDKRSAKSVRRLYGKYATGNFSLRQMADWAREAGLTLNRSGRDVNKPTIYQVLRNPIYAGRFMWHGETYMGIHRPLISRNIWERVQSILTRKFQKNG